MMVYFKKTALLFTALCFSGVTGVANADMGYGSQGDDIVSMKQFTIRNNTGDKKKSVMFDISYVSASGDEKRVVIQDKKPKGEIHALPRDIEMVKVIVVKDPSGTKILEYVVEDDNARHFDYVKPVHKAPAIVVRSQKGK